MRLRDRIHQVLKENQVPDEGFYLSRMIAEAVSTQRAVGFKGTFRRDRKATREWVSPVTKHTKDDT